jgi:hypothetical protein
MTAISPKLHKGYDAGTAQRSPLRLQVEALRAQTADEHGELPTEHNVVFVSRGARRSPVLDERTS